MKLFASLLVLSSLALSSLASPVEVEAIPTPAAAKPDKVKRFATNKLPASSGYSALSAAKTIAAGASFDGGMYRYDRGVSCSDGEGGQADAVFVLNSGATLKNVIIGANQKEGVHCLGPCTIQTVWWADVCEDALTIKQTSGTSYIIGGGAFGASDKIIQHNGGGTVSVKDFYAQNFGKVYRSCGNCGTQYTRQVTMSGVWAVSGSTIAGVNSNYGDKATIADSCASGVSTICEWYQGNNNGGEPTKLGSGISSYCVYTAGEVDDCP